MRKIINLQDALNHPAIINQSKADFVSNHYGLVRTEPIINMFKDNGWQLTQAKINRVRTKGEQFAKHALMFQNPELSDGDSVPQIYFINSHDRTSAVHFHVGFFRFVCENGIIVGDALGQGFKVFHSGRDLETNIYERLVATIKAVPQAVELRNELKSIKVDDNMRLDYLLMIKDLILSERNIILDNTLQLADVKRVEDREQDAWTLFNIAQENSLGALSGTRQLVDVNGQEIRRKIKVRSIKAIDKDVSLNRVLFDETVKFFKVG